MIIPCLLYLKIKSPAGRNFALWLPLFLLWPIVILVMLVLLPLWLLAAFFLVWVPEGRMILTLPVRLYALLCALRGLSVDVEEKNHKIKMIVY